MKKENKKTWESPKLLSLINSDTEGGTIPGIEGRLLFSHMIGTTSFTIGAESSNS